MKTLICFGLLLCVYVAYAAAMPDPSAAETKSAKAESEALVPEESRHGGGWGGGRGWGGGGGWGGGRGWGGGGGWGHGGGHGYGRGYGRGYGWGR